MFDSLADLISDRRWVRFHLGQLLLRMPRSGKLSASKRNFGNRSGTMSHLIAYDTPMIHQSASSDSAEMTWRMFGRSTRLGRATSLTGAPAAGVMIQQRSPANVLRSGSLCAKLMCNVVDVQRKVRPV
jgi:hypothetical protein